MITEHFESHVLPMCASNLPVIETTTLEEILFDEACELEREQFEDEEARGGIAYSSNSPFLSQSEGNTFFDFQRDVERQQIEIEISQDDLGDDDCLTDYANIRGGENE